MRVLRSVGLLFILLLFITVPAQAWVDDYWPLTQDSWIEYKVFEITGTWYNDSKVLVTTSRNRVGNRTITIDIRTCPGCFGGGPVYHEVFPAGGSLGEGGCVISNRVFYGEAVGNSGAVYIPFLPKLCKDKIIGLTAAGNSILKNNCTECSNTGADVDWKWRLISGGDWGVFDDTYRTGLVECGYGVYNYVFMKNVGLVNFWYLTEIDGDNCEPGGVCTGTGYEFYATSWGGQ